MTRLFFFLSIFLLTYTISFSKNTEEGNGNINGTVTTSDHKSAAAVTVQLKGTKLAVVTGDKGEFSFKNIQPGNYEIEISSMGYNKITKLITVEIDKTITVDFQLSESAAQLSEVVVSTNRKSYIAEKPSASLRLNAPLIEIPQNITVATKQTLIDMGLLTKGEIYRLSSGITKSYGGSLDMTVQIRGTDATYGTYRNGVGGPIWWNAQEDVAMIERMEFVKGPAGFMLANAEPGGLINTVTKQPTHHQIAEIGFGAGSWNMMRTNIDLGGEFKKGGKLTYRLNAGIQTNNEYYQFGDFDRYFVCPVLKYDFSENTSLTLEVNYVKARAQENTHSSVSIDGDFWALPTNLSINDPNNDKFLGADFYNRIFLTHKLNDKWTFNAQAAYMTTNWDGTSLQLSGISPAKDTLYRANYYTDWFGSLSNLQLFLDGTFQTGKNAEHKMLVGLDCGDGSEGSTYGGTWEDYFKFPLAIGNPSYYLPKGDLKFSGDLYSWIATNKWQALYVQDHLKLFNKLVVTLAGRYTHLVTGQDYNNPPDDPAYEQTDNKFTPRIGLTYLFTNDISAYALHDESFLSQRGAIYGGTRLPPLTGNNNEIGVKALLFKKQLAITASVYDIKKNDVGTSDPLHDGFYLKTGQIRSTGVDLDIAGRINANLYINGNYSFVNARITKDENKTVIGLKNAGTAQNLANLWLKYQINDGIMKGVGFGAGVQYTGKRSGVSPGWNDMEGNKYLPAYTVFDAGISYSIGRINVGLNAYNIGNKKYASNGWWYPEFEEWIFDMGEPFNVRLQINVRL